MNRVIVTGGNGFIGRHLVKKLLSCRPHSVALISNTSHMNDNFLADRNLLKDIRSTYYNADIRDSKTISDIFRDERPDTCIHLAAKISVPDSIKNPDVTMDINVNGTLNVLEACHNSKVNNFVFASSAAVYGDVRELPISESHALNPLSPYGTSKMQAEQHVFSYNKLKKIQNTISLRFFNVYGDGQVNENDVVTKFARRLSKGLPPIIYGNGKHTRDFISVDDVADSILLSIRVMEESKKSKNNQDYNRSSSPVFNIGTGTATSIKELAHKMISISGLEVKPVYVEGTQDTGVISESYADMTKAKRTLNFVAKKNLETGLRELAELQHISKSTL